MRRRARRADDHRRPHPHHAPHRAVQPILPRDDFHVPIREGRFELHGLAPGASTRIHILDPEDEWGLSVDVTGHQAGEDLTIRLQPCGQARARFLGSDGKPIAGKRPLFEIVVTPGPRLMISGMREQAELGADAAIVANVDRKHYWNLPGTDADGRITLISLIPGALYRITDFMRGNDQNERILSRKEFTVKTGETLGLGDILIENPGS